MSHRLTDKPAESQPLRRCPAGNAHPALHPLGLLACVLLALFGCSESSTLTSVVGTVLLDGKPLAHGSVTTLPKTGRGAVGAIDDQGRFELVTRGQGTGVPAGVHRVAVVAFQDPGATDLEGRREIIVPQRYTNPTTSGLTIEVVANQENVVTLELTTKP